MPGDPVDRARVRLFLLNFEKELFTHVITLDQNRHLAIGVHDVDVVGLVVQVNVANLEVHAFFKQDKTAAV
jgi:hypothetical protein